MKGYGLYEKFLQRNIMERVILVNIVIFILTYLLNTLSFLFNESGNLVIEWFSLKPSFEVLLFRPWTIVTYGFLHLGFFHILFNLLVLYYFGMLFLDFFSSKQFLNYFFLGIIAGGLIYMLSYNFLPALRTKESILVGASAGVTAIVIGIASHIPNYAMHFRFIGSIKLIYIAIFLVVLDLVQIPDGNAGGHLAHLGGALIGFVLTRYGNQGRGLFSWSGISFDKKSSPFKKVYKSPSPKKAEPESGYDQKKIDAILDKISKSGYDTLTKEEKDYLFRAGKN